MEDAIIFDAIRSPRGKGKQDGSLYELTSVYLSAEILKNIRDRNQLNTTLVEDVIWGNVTQVGEQGGCLARSAVLKAGFDEATPGLSINRFCASGLEAVNLAANQIKGGAGSAYVAGGVEMMSRVPMGSDGAAIAVDPSLAMDTHVVPQGISADIISSTYGFSGDDVDAYAVESQRRANQAWEENRFKGSVVPIKDQNGINILSKDESIRPETSMQSLGALKASFKDMGEVMPGFDGVAIQKYPDLAKVEHVHHAGNSSGIVDGSAAVLLGNKEFGNASGIKPRARILSTAKVGTDPTIMLTGPIPAARKALESANMEISDIDIFEVNEAFASVVLRFIQANNLNPEIVNVNGGAIAMGHPLGATGARITGKAAELLVRENKKYALASQCIGYGMGIATIIESTK